MKEVKMKPRVFHCSSEAEYDAINTIRKYIPGFYPGCQLVVIDNQGWSGIDTGASFKAAKFLSHLIKIADSFSSRISTLHITDIFNEYGLNWKPEMLEVVDGADKIELIELPTKLEVNPGTTDYEPLKSFSGIKVGDVLVSLEERVNRRIPGDMFRVIKISGSYLYYKEDLNNHEPKTWRAAKPEEIAAFEEGITNINDMKKEPELRWKENDTVTFTIKGEELTYVLRPKYWMLSSGSANDKVFNLLEVDPAEYCTKHYGYKGFIPCQNGWPETKNENYTALNRVMEAILKDVEAINQAESKSKLKFKVGDRVKIVKCSNGQDSSHIGAIRTIKHIDEDDCRSPYYCEKGFWWEESDLELYVKEPKTFSSVRERLDHLHSKGFDAKGAFRELFGFDMPAYETKLYINGDFRLFHPGNFIQVFYEKGTGGYGDVDFIIYSGFDNLASTVEERICKCQIVFTLGPPVVVKVPKTPKPQEYKWEEMPTTSASYPYRVKTWEELVATPGVTVFDNGILRGTSTFRKEMKFLCGKAMGAHEWPYATDGWYIHEWMITKNTDPVPTSKGGSTEAEMKMATVGIAYTYETPKELKVKSNKPKTTIDTTVEEVVSVNVRLRKPGKSNLLKI